MSDGQEEESKISPQNITNPASIQKAWATIHEEKFVKSDVNQETDPIQPPNTG